VLTSLNTKCSGQNTYFKFRKTDCASDTVKRPLSDLKTAKKANSDKNCFYVQDGFIDDYLWSFNPETNIIEFDDNKTTMDLVASQSIPTISGTTTDQDKYLVWWSNFGNADKTAAETSGKALNNLTSQYCATGAAITSAEKDMVLWLQSTNVLLSKYINMKKYLMYLKVDGSTSLTWKPPRLNADANCSLLLNTENPAETFKENQDTVLECLKTKG